MERYKQFEKDMVPFIPVKPDFDDMKNKIFFKQHSHHNNNKKKGKKKKKNNGKRKDSPTLKDVNNPKEVKRQRLSGDEIEGKDGMVMDQDVDLNDG
eukprot:13373_1